MKKIKNIIEDIKRIDAEIIKIESLANEADSEKFSLFFSISTENKIKNSTGISAEHYTHNIEFGIPDYLSILREKDIQQYEPIKQNKIVNEYKFSFSNTDCLRVLSVIIKIKISQRESLKSQLCELGVLVE